MTETVTFCLLVPEVGVRSVDKKNDEILNLKDWHNMIFIVAPSSV